MRKGDEARTAALRLAATSRTADVDERLVDAVRYLDRKNQPAGVAAVARQAGVSRSTVYARKTVVDEVVALRSHGTGPEPIATRATEASMATMNKALRAEITRLEAELKVARREISRLIATQRSTGTVTPMRRPTSNARRA